MLRRAERMPAEMKAAHEGERAEALRLAHDLVDQGCGLPAARRQQDAHARPQVSDRLLDADRAGHAAEAPAQPGPASARRRASSVRTTARSRT